MVLSFTLAGFGCSNSKEEINLVKNTAVSFLEAYKTFDLSKLDELSDVDYSIEDEFKSLIKESFFTSLDIYARSTENMEYEILDIKVKGEKTVVSAKVTNENVGEVATYAVVKAVKEQAKDSSMTEDDRNEYIRNCFFETLESFKPDVYTKEIEINLVKKDGNWIVEPLGDEDFNAVVGNMVASIIGMFEEYEI